MINPTRSASAVVKQVALCLLAAALSMDIGCVSQRAYEQLKAEMQEQTQALETVREDVRGLDQEIAVLQATNRRKNITIDELLATIQREQELLPIMREEAEERHSSLKTQVASLLDQSWHLARKIADLRQANASLRTMADQYKQEMRLVQAQTQAHTPVLVAAHSEQLPITASTATEEPAASAIPEPPPVEVEEEQPSSLMSDESRTPPQVAQAASATPDLTPVTSSVSSPSPAPVIVEPPEAEESWFDMIAGWLLAFWNWLIS